MRIHEPPSWFSPVSLLTILFLLSAVPAFADPPSSMHGTPHGDSKKLIRAQPPMAHPILCTVTAITQKLRIRGMVTIPGLPTMMECKRDMAAKDMAAMIPVLRILVVIKMRENTLVTF